MPTPNRYFVFALIFVSSLLCYDSLAGQAPLAESIHLHTDKQKYLPGDTIWFKAYIMQDGALVTDATTLFVSLFDGDKPVSETIRVPLMNAMADGSIVLPDTGMNGNLAIGAATDLMLAAKTNAIYVKPLELTGYVRRTPVATSANETIQFFAGGGHFVSDVPNTVALKLEDEFGRARDTKGHITDDKGQLVDSFETVHDGMASFKLTPVKETTYYARWKDGKGVEQKMALPAAENAAIALHVEEAKGVLFYIIQNPASTSAMEKLHVEAFLNNLLVYQASLNMAELSVIAGRIPLQNLPSGVLELLVYDADKHLQAERKVFVNQQNVAGFAEVNVTTKNLEPRSKNVVEITIPDTTVSNFSLAVYDATLVPETEHGNMYEDLVLAGSLNGPVKDATWYFTDTSASRKQALDLLLQTNEWKQNSQDTTTTGVFSNYLEVTGTVADLKGRMLAGERLTMIVSMADSSKQFYKVETDKSGKFRQDGLVFFDSATVAISVENPGKKKVTINALEMPSFAGYGALLPKKNAAFESMPVSGSILDSLVADGRKRGAVNTLENVTVRAYKWRMDKMLKMDERYAAGPFRGGATSWAFDVMNDPIRDSKLDIYNYLVSKGIPALEIKYKGYQKELRYMKGEIVYFIDESQVDKQRLENIIVWDIAYVKFFPRFGGVQGFPPTLCIYLKKAGDDMLGLKEVPGKMVSVKLAGYTSIKQFSSPDYSDKNVGGVADVRTTLLWEPFIELGGGVRNVSIPFYNNDFSKRLKLVLEGVNEAGKIIRVEKVIE